MKPTLTAAMLLASLAVPALHAASTGDPLKLLSTTALPGFEGDFDHFAIDVKGNQMFVSAEKHHSVEIFNLKGEHTGSITEVDTLHTLAYDAKKEVLLVADGGNGSCEFFNGKTHKLVKKIDLMPSPDAGYFDAEKHIFYIGNGGKGSHADYSYISLVSAETMSETEKIKISSNNLEAMALDRKRNLMYVNMRDKAVVGVVDLASKSLKTTWQVPDLKLNTPLRFDPKTDRIFIAGRKPGLFYVLNAIDGKLVTKMDSVDIADDMTFDPARHRIYVSGFEGLSVYKQEGADRYSKLAQFDTKHGKTSVYVPAVNKFFIIHTKTDDDIAGLQVYQVND